jgi:aldehyde:ferredoxin oxidoreductase
MGSKNLNAIAITAKRHLRLDDPESFKRLVKEQSAAYQNSPGFKSHKEWGTTDTQKTTNVLGIFPTRNFREGRIDNYETMLGADYRKLRTGVFGCYSCPAYCGKAHTVTSGPYAGIHSDGPEYESIWSFTGPSAVPILKPASPPMLFVTTWVWIQSAPATVSFAYELLRRDYLSKADTDGLELKWAITWP